MERTSVESDTLALSLRHPNLPGWMQAFPRAVLTNERRAQSRWFQTTKIHPLAILEASSLKGRCQWGFMLARASRGEPRRPPPASLGHSTPVPPCVHEAFSSVSKLPRLSLIETPVTGFRAHAKSRMISP